MSDSVLQRVAAGERQAVEECLDRFGGLVWSVARRMTADSADAEDAVQEVFIDLWRNADRYDPARASEATFVVMLARRRLIDRYRKSGRRPREVPVDQALEMTQDDASPSLASEDAEFAVACLTRLRPEEQRVLKLAIYQGMSQSQIVEATGMPLGTVKTHSRRGLMRLRELVRQPTSNPLTGGAR